MKITYRIYFRKHGVTRFLGHLDLQDLFQRSLKRAKLPVAYSEGFNPHQLISFGLPLSLGMQGEREILDIDMVEEIHTQTLIERLNKQLPEGMSVVEAVQMPEGTKKAASLVCAADYSIIFPNAELSAQLSGIIAQIAMMPEILISKTNKKGVIKESDIKPDIHNLVAVDSDCPELRCTLAAGGKRNLKPEVIAKLVCEIAGMEFVPYRIKYIRHALILESKQVNEAEANRRVNFNG